MVTLKKLLNFVSLTNKFQQVKRVIFVKNEDRQENDLEHSAQLALVAWYIADSNKLKLNQDLVIKYALIHDLVEIYAGDVNFYDLAKKKNKHEKELKSALKLKTQFPEFTSLHKLIQKYESRSDPESKFIYSLDKYLPIMNIFLDRGRTWHKDNITLEMLITHKTKPVSVSSHGNKYFDDLIKLLKKHKHYFPKN